MVFILKAETGCLCIAVTLDDFLIVCNPLDDLRIFLDLFLNFVNSHLLLVEGLGLDLALGLECGNDVLVLPADVM